MSDKFRNYLGGGIESPLTKFAGDTELNGGADMSKRPGETERVVWQEQYEL